MKINPNEPVSKDETTGEKAGVTVRNRRKTAA